MGQQEIYTFLKNHKRKWFTTKEITEAIKVAAQPRIASSLKRMSKYEKNLEVKKGKVGTENLWRLK